MLNLLLWALGLAGVALAGVFVLRLMWTIFCMATGRAPTPPPRLLIYVGSFAGLALFAIAMMLSMRR